jgi:preprotein translocase subunit SecY
VFISDFFKKILLIIFSIFIYRFGSHIPVPTIDPSMLSDYVKQFDGTMIEIINTFSGGAVKRFSILTIGIMPYITATIFVQMLSFFNNSIKQLKSEGEKGALKINLITRKLTLSICFFQAIGIASFIASQTTNQGELLVLNTGLSYYIVTVASLVTGTMFLIWMADRITDLGLGNGLSIIIFAAIISSFPSIISSITSMHREGALSDFYLIFIILCFLSLILFITFFESSQRRIKTNSSTYSYNEKNYLPLKVNMAGIMPTIFASTIIMIPISISSYLSKAINYDFISSLKVVFGESTFLFLLNFSILIVFFSFFYVGITFSAKKIAKDLQNKGTFINGIRPGYNTEVFIEKLVKRITFLSAFYMVFISIFPEILIKYMNIPFYLGGTSLLIAVTVSKDWIEQYELSSFSKKYSKVEDRVGGYFK